VTISSNSVALNYNYKGSPFVRVPGSNGIDTTNLSYDWRGSPFVAVASAIVSLPQLDGWGAPYGDGYGVWGSIFGDGEPGYGFPYSLHVMFPYGTTYSDEGGDVVLLVGTWSVTSTYKVFLRDVSNAIWPQNGYGCFSCVAGMSDVIAPSRDGERLYFSLPPLPLGFYSIEVYSGSALVSEAGVISILRRDRPWPAKYELAASMPEAWKSGARDIRFDAQATDDNLPPYRPLDALLSALGRTMHRFGGAPCTRLRSKLEPGDVYALVETTLGFFGENYIWVDGYLLRVSVNSTDVTNRRMTIETNYMPDGSFADENTPVVMDFNYGHPALFVEPDVPPDRLIPRRTGGAV